MNLDTYDDILAAPVEPEGGQGRVPQRVPEGGHPPQVPEGGQQRVIKILEHAPLLHNRTASRHGVPQYPNGVYETKQENPRQRQVLEMAATGMKNKEIAEATGYHPMTVGAILRQPMVQQTLVDEIRRRVDAIDEEVLKVVKEGCLEGARRMLKIIKNDKAKESSQVAAAVAFMERRYGKANQPVNAGTSIDLNSLSDEQLAQAIISESTTRTADSAAEGGLSGA